MVVMFTQHPIVWQKIGREAKHSGTGHVTYNTYFTVYGERIIKDYRTVSILNGEVD